MKKLFSRADRWEHYQEYVRLPFGREEEFRGVKRSRFLIKKQYTQIYAHLGWFSWKVRQEGESFSIFLFHEFTDGRVGGVAAHNVPHKQLDAMVEKCYARRPTPGWTLLA